MPVDPASLVALSGLAVRDLPDDAELIAETGPPADSPRPGADRLLVEPDAAAAPVAEGPQVDVAAPFWMEPVPAAAQEAAPAAAAPSPLHEPEQLTDVGIGLVAASPEVVEPADEAPGRAGLPSLASISLASRAFAAKHLPAAPLASLRDVSLDLSSWHPSGWRMPDLGTFPTLDAPARRRLALLAGSSVAAGLAAGLAAPVAAEAAPAPATGTAPAPSPEATEAALLAAPSPFAQLAGTSGTSPRPGAAQPVATARPAAATPAAAKPAAAKSAAAKPAAAKPATAKPAAPAVPTAPAPVTAAPATSDPAGAPSGDGGAALIATLLAPAANPFAAPAPVASSAPVATDPPQAGETPAALPAAAPTTGPSAAPAAPPAASPAASLPSRTTAAAVVVVADPPAPHPGRPAPAATPAPVTPVWKVTRPLPAHSGTGRRIVYAERSAHLWIVGADGTVLRDYKVTGRADRPKPGSYKVFSKSRTTSNPKEKLTFDLMVRFTHGVTGAPIGFHTIPKTYSGHPIQSEKDLGRAIGMGGCVRQARVDAEWLYAWSRVGDTVVVLH